MKTMPKTGDEVKWGTPQGETRGTVEKIVTSATKVKGHTAKASQEHPEVVVKSRKSGKPSVHRPEALTKA